MATIQEPKAFQGEQPDGDYSQYRTLSKAAVTSTALGLLSIAGFMFPVLLAFALLGTIAGIVGYRTVRRFPNEFVGLAPAVFGTLLCIAVFIGGTITHAVVYATEVPEGFQRISFQDLKADGPYDLPPESTAALDEQQVFIKGYMYPDGQQKGIRQFVLIPDLGTCCFGGQPKLTDMVQVTLKDPHRIDYSMRKRKLAGVLTVDRALKPVDGLGGVYYQLMAEHAK